MNEPTKHTPGPWHFGKNPDGRISIREEGGMHVAHAIFADDARLIAAAPDLLAALQAFFKWWATEECAEINPEPLPDELGRIMEAAIEKATKP